LFCEAVGVIALAPARCAALETSVMAVDTSLTGALERRWRLPVRVGCFC